MANNFKLLQPYTEQRVILAAVSDELQQDDNLEPPFTRLRFSSSAYVYLDSSFSSSVDPSNIVIGGTGGELFTRKVKRFAVKGVDLSWVTPNVNIRNNTLMFQIDTDATTYTASIPIGWYSTVSSLYAALATAMNTAAGTGSSIEITATFTGSTAYNITYSGHTIAIIGGTAYQLGQFQYGFTPGYSTLEFVASYPISNSYLGYTRYININSQELTQWSKIPCSGTDTTSSCVLKLYVTDSSTAPGSIFFNIQEPLQWINYKKDVNISVVDINLTDEWNSLLYIPPEFYNSFYFQLIITSQL